MKHLLLTLFLLLILDSAYAKFNLNVGIIHKKSADKGTPLVSELHSSETVYQEPIVINMKDEVILNIHAYFSPEKGIYGPSQKITIRGNIRSMSLQEKKDLLITVDLGEKVIQTFEFSDKRVIIISFHPVL